MADLKALALELSEEGDQSAGDPVRRLRGVDGKSAQKGGW